MKPLRRACLVLASALALVLLTGRGATAGPPTDQLRESIDRALQALGNPDLRKEIRTRERRAALRGIANEAFDLDRKSTRLNSSHLVISYAVFCLKKKKHHVLCATQA